MTKSIVTDSSPLIILIKSGLSDLLPSLFEEVLVPPAVFDEILAGPGDDVARQILLKLPWVVRANVSRSNLGPPVQYKLGKGEAEAIALAVSMDAAVLIDDAAGRACSKSLGVPILGTGGLLVLAKRRGLINSVSDSLQIVRSAGLWIGQDIEELLISIAGE